MDNGDRLIAPIYAVGKEPDPRITNFHMHGLTKRELFAAMIFQGLASNPHLSKINSESLRANVPVLNLQDMAVESADNLLAELEK